MEKFHLFKTKFWICTYSIICSAFTWTDFIMIREKRMEIDVCVYSYHVSLCINSLVRAFGGKSSSFRVEKNIKLPMIRNKSLTQNYVGQLFFKLRSAIRGAQGFYQITMLAFPVEHFV